MIYKAIENLLLQITRTFEPHITQNSLILMEEARDITFGIFEILLNFCVFLIFLKIPKILKTRYWPRYSTFKIEDISFTK